MSKFDFYLGKYMLSVILFFRMKTRLSTSPSLAEIEARFAKPNPPRAALSRTLSAARSGCDRENIDWDGQPSTSP
jgi:hypothetical protein